MSLTHLTMSDAIKEAYAHAPADVTYYDTLEVEHVTFTDSIKVVVSDAPLTTNQGTFIACPNVSLELPDLEGGVTGEMRITVNFLPKEAQEAIKDASKTTYPITLKYRQYVEANSDPEAELPISLDVTTIEQTPISVTAAATFPDLNNQPFPKRLMTTTILPGGRI